MGNICRSPTAEGVFRHKVRAAGLADRVFIDSAGTHDYHPGAPPDARSQAHARTRGYDISDLRARAATADDVERFDVLLVMDDLNYSTLIGRIDPSLHHKVQKFTDFCVTLTAHEVPDPYYGERVDFERVLDLVEDASEGLLAKVRGRLVV